MVDLVESLTFSGRANPMGYDAISTGVDGLHGREPALAGGDVPMRTRHFICLTKEISTKWAPQIAKLVNITPIIMSFGLKPSYNWGAPH